jgi:integrase
LHAVTADMEASERRKRGSIRRMGAGLQVRVSAGTDPSTGERIVLVETVAVEKPGNERSERAALNQAEKIRTRLLGEADSLKVARTKSTLGALLDRWLPQHEVDPTTRMNYESQIRNYIQPNLGDVPLLLLVQDASERLETFYARLRRCRHLCPGKPFIEKHHAGGSHDCATVKCQVHVCAPYAASSVRQIHAILSGAMSAAVRWGWISYNPMPSVKPPMKKRPQPRPPSSEQMACIVDAAWAASDEWGLYVWLSAVTGARRGEVIALQWNDVDLTNLILRLDENYVRASDGMILKDTKPGSTGEIAV